SSDGSVRLWDVDRGVLRQTLTAGAGPIATVAFAPAGARLACGGRDGCVRIWAARGGPAPLVLRGHGGAVLGVAFRPDGEPLASAGGIRSDRTTPSQMHLWDVSTGASLLVRPGPDTSVAFSPDGGLVASAGGEQLWVWDVRAGSEALVLRGHLDRLEAVAFNP